MCLLLFSTRFSLLMESGSDKITITSNSEQIFWNFKRHQLKLGYLNKKNIKMQITNGVRENK